MNRRFDGAIFEVAAAILIVGALTAIVGTLASTAFGGTAASEPGAGPIVALVLGLDALTLTVGILVRSGRAWLACINTVAILLFIELTAVPSGNAVAGLLAVLDGFVFVRLARQRAWFDWRPSTGLEGIAEGDVP